MKNLAIGLLLLIITGYIVFAGYLANDFVQGVRSDVVSPLSITILNQSDENKRLSVRIELAREVVLKLRGENCLLKGSVKLGAEMLQEQIEDNTKLYDTIEGLKWRIEFLQTLVNNGPKPEYPSGPNTNPEY